MNVERLSPLSSETTKATCDLSSSPAACREASSLLLSPAKMRLSASLWCTPRTDMVMILCWLEGSVTRATQPNLVASHVRASSAVSLRFLSMLQYSHSGAWYGVFPLLVSGSVGCDAVCWDCADQGSYCCFNRPLMGEGDCGDRRGWHLVRSWYQLLPF